MRPRSPDGGSKPEVSTEVFSIQYEGPALETGQMDVRDLAPALLALGSLCDEANALLNGSETKASLQVRADFKKGSFEAHLHLGVSWYEHLRTVLLGKPKDAKEILEILGFYGGLAIGTVKGLLWLVKAIGPRKVTDSISLGDGTTKIVVENNITIIADSHAWELYRKRSVIHDIQSVAAPLSREGVEALHVKRRGQIEGEITKSDLPAIWRMPDNSPEPDIVSESTITKVYEVITGSKNPEYIWRLSDGEAVISVHIEDEQFFEDIASGKLIISLGDYLRAEVRSESRFEQGKLKTTTRVTRILGHIPAHNPNENPPRLLEP